MAEAPPLGAGGHRQLHHHGRDRAHQTGLRGQRQERGRQQDAVLGVAPAGQRLRAADAAIAQADLRLQEDLEVTLLQRDPELADRRQPDGRLLVGVEVADPASGGLGRSDRERCLAHQRARIVPGEAAGGDPDAGVHLHRVLDPDGIDRHRLVELGQQAVGDPLSHLTVGVGQEHGELVATEPGQGLGRPQLGPQPAGDLAQHVVAAVGAEGRLQLGEPVDVDQQQTDPVGPAAHGVAARGIERLRGGGLIGQGRRELLAGGQPGQPLMRHEPSVLDSRPTLNHRADVLTAWRYATGSARRRPAPRPARAAGAPTRPPRCGDRPPPRARTPSPGRRR